MNISSSPRGVRRAFGGATPALQTTTSRASPRASSASRARGSTGSRRGRRGAVHVVAPALAPHRLARLGVAGATGHQDPCAAPREPDRRRVADPRVGPRHQRHPTVEAVLGLQRVGECLLAEDVLHTCQCSLHWVVEPSLPTRSPVWRVVRPWVSLRARASAPRHGDGVPGTACAGDRRSPLDAAPSTRHDPGSSQNWSGAMAVETERLSTLRLTAAGRRGELVLDHPGHANALGAQTLRDLEAAGRWFDARLDVHVVVVRGEGASSVPAQTSRTCRSPARCQPRGSRGIAVANTASSAAAPSTRSSGCARSRSPVSTARRSAAAPPHARL